MSPIHTILLWARADNDNDNDGGIKSIPQTFSSWDKCMQKDYCKWPVIVAIIIGSLIVLSIVACVVNCLCCGYQCCTGCCQCCSMCCPDGSRRRNRPKYLDDPAPYYNQSPPPPQPQPVQPPINTAYQSPYMPPPFRGPQVAQFDSTPRHAPSPSPAPPVHEDSLPAMPTWDDAVTRRVEDTTSPTSPRHEDMEMAPLNPSHQPPGSAHRLGLGRSGYMELPTSTAADLPSPTGYRGQTYDHVGAYTDYPPYPYETSSPHEHGVSRYSPGPAPAPVPSTMPQTYVSEPQPHYYQSQQPAEHAYQEYPPPSSPPLDPGRPPSILMSGRKPVPNSMRIV